MKPIQYTLSAAVAGTAAILLFGSGTSEIGAGEKEAAAAVESNSQKLTVSEAGDYTYRFAFVGCNRIDRGDRHDVKFQPSMANVDVLEAIFDDILALEENKPQTLFFLGDMILGESSTAKLDSQLRGWVDLYTKKMKASGIELVAVPGNHEMLTYTSHGEIPLEGATDVWLRHMAPFMPKGRETAPSVDGVDNRLTFAFARGDVGFVVMNTDSYNAEDSKHGGVEGIIPTSWIVERVADFKDDPKIKHVFVLGHKPYWTFYGAGVPQRQTGHTGLPDGKNLWDGLYGNQVNSMLSAHVHDYQRMQPGNPPLGQFKKRAAGTYQIIAGNGGSTNGAAVFFGYSMASILNSGEVELCSRGMDVNWGSYTELPENPVFTVRDQTILTWAPNKNPYVHPVRTSRR